MWMFDSFWMVVPALLGYVSLFDDFVGFLMEVVALCAFAVCI